MLLLFYSCYYRCYIFVVVVGVVVVVVFHVAMLLSEQEGGTKIIKKVGQKWNNLRPKSKRAIMFPNVKIMVFLFLWFLRFVSLFFKNTIKIGVSANFWHCYCLWFWGAKSWVNNWSTIGSITGPHLPHMFWGTCGPTIEPRLSFQKCFVKLCFLFKNLIFLQKEEAKKKEHVDQLLTQQRVKCGPNIDPTAYIYICCRKRILSLSGFVRENLVPLMCLDSLLWRFDLCL